MTALFQNIGLIFIAAACIINSLHIARVRKEVYKHIEMLNGFNEDRLNIVRARDDFKTNMYAQVGNRLKELDDRIKTLEK